MRIRSVVFGTSVCLAALCLTGVLADTTYTEQQGPPQMLPNNACQDEQGSKACSGPKGTCFKPTARTCPSGAFCRFEETVEPARWGRCQSTTGPTCDQFPTVACAKMHWKSGNPLTQTCATATFECEMTLFFVSGCELPPPPPPPPDD
jgi:hypothetical protein